MLDFADQHVYLEDLLRDLFGHPLLFEGVEPILDHVVSPVSEFLRDGGPLCPYFLIGEQQFEILSEPPLALVDIWIEVIHPFLPALMRSLEVVLLDKEAKGDVLPVDALVLPLAIEELQHYALEEIYLLAAPLAPESVDPRDYDEQLVSQVDLGLVGEETAEDCGIDIDLDS